MPSARPDTVVFIVSGARTMTSSMIPSDRLLAITTGTFWESFRSPNAYYNVAEFATSWPLLRMHCLS